MNVLPNEVLLIIFSYCNEYDLLRLSEVCKRFYEIVHTDVVWIKARKQFLVTNQMSERFRERCNKILDPRAAWLVSYNWQYGKYKKRQVFNTLRSRVIPWLKMTNSTLWWCCGNELLGFDREDGIIQHEFLCSDYHSDIYRGGDICKFILWKNFIICGYTDGSIIYFLKNIDENRCHGAKILRSNHSCVNAIDTTSKNVIAGLECGAVTIQRHPDMDSPEKNVYDESEVCIRLLDKVRSLSIDPTGVKFAVGSSGTTTNSPPLHIIDIERYTMVNTMRHTWKHGAGILDMVWDDPNTLLTCGYDTYIRKWDLRTGRCVCSWADPTDATLYCVSSDHQYTMIAGTQYNCLAVLWDQRMNDFVQMYYVNSRGSSRRSPIYSLQFDSTCMYCATDRHLFELTFSTRSCQKLDYKSLYLSCRLSRGSSR